MPGTTSERVSEMSEYKLRTLWESSKPEASPEMDELWVESRDRLPKNLFQFCQLLNIAVTERCHRQLCEEFFPKLDPNIPLDDLGWGDRLLFWPRESFKSTVANAFCGAVVCAYPNVKIAVQSSKDDLARGFVDEIRNYFLSPEDGDGNLVLTRLQALFPEHVVSERAQKASGTFTTPARRKYSKEGTVDALSIEESKASVHYDLGRNDDVASETNSGIGSTHEARAIVGKKLLDSRNLFSNSLTIGTPQFDDDAYVMLQDNLGDDLLFMRAPAWETKPESSQKAEAELSEADFTLLFPYDSNGASRLTYRKLRGYQRANAESFKTQQLCISATAKPKIEITQQMVDGHCLPAGSELFALNPAPAISVWDLGYVTNAKADFSVGCAGSRDEFRGAIVRDIQKGRWQKADLIAAMVAQAVQFRVHTIWIEGTNGAEWIRDELIAGLQRAGATTTRVDFIPVENVFDAKALRFKQVHDALKNNELWFEIDSSQTPILQELTKPRGKKYDDFTDSLARFIKKVQEPIEMKPRNTEASPSQLLFQEKVLRDRVYGYTDPEREQARVYNEISPSHGFIEEELKPEAPPKEWEGCPVFSSETAWLYKER
jgi:hypothetical protein